MPNFYASLSDLKSVGMANITTSAYDTDLFDALDDGSRRIEKDTDRFFYIYEGTFYQDGGAARLILDWDVQSITSLKIDSDGDGTYETTLTVDMNSPTTPPDVFAYPLNISPKTRLEVNPYGSAGNLSYGAKSIQITGVFGYGNDWPASYLISNANTLTSGITTSTATIFSVTSSSANPFEIGQTLRITAASTGNTEQAFVGIQSTSTALVVQRGVNGTSALSVAATTATIAVYDYPQAIRKAVLIYAMRIWKRRESAFQNQVGNPELGTVTVWKGNDPDYDKAVLKYKKVKRGWYQ